MQLTQYELQHIRKAIIESPVEAIKSELIHYHRIPESDVYVNSHGNITSVNVDGSKISIGDFQDMMNRLNQQYGDVADFAINADGGRVGVDVLIG